MNRSFQHMHTMALKLVQVSHMLCKETLAYQLQFTKTHLLCTFVINLDAVRKRQGLFTQVLFAFPCRRIYGIITDHHGLCTLTHHHRLPEPSLALHTLSSTRSRSDDIVHSEKKLEANVKICSCKVVKELLTSAASLAEETTAFLSL